MKKILFAVAAMVIAFTANAQQQRASEHLTVTGTIGKANVSITYGAPTVKGREIWGALVPYDKPWRAGADEATILQTDRDLWIDGKKVPAGKYSVFVTPGKKEWIVTLNSETGQWGIKRDGSANFDPGKNVVEVKVKPESADSTIEELTYDINDGGFSLQWADVILPVKIKS